MKRIEELDFTRIIAMIAVITIHVTSAYIGYQSNILVMGMNVAFILNQLTRFAVPLFILLSGTSLGLSANDDSYREFLHKRLTKIGIPYLAWTAVYIIYNNHSDLRPNQGIGSRKCRRNPERAAGEGGGVADAGGPL